MAYCALVSYLSQNVLPTLSPQSCCNKSVRQNFQRREDGLRQIPVVEKGKFVGLVVGLFVGFIEIVGAIEIVGEDVGLIIGLDDGSLDGDGVGSSLYVV